LTGSSTGLKDAMIPRRRAFLNLERKGELISVSIKADQKEKLYNLLGKEYPDLKGGRKQNGGECALR